MIDLKNIEEIIIKEKSILRNKSKNFRENFSKIEKYILSEIIKIEDLKKNNKQIIPEIKFQDLNSNTEEFEREVKQKGCVIIRDVFEDSMMHKMNKDLENYIEENNYYEDQKKKADLDKYFSELKSGKPQIFGLFKNTSANKTIC